MATASDLAQWWEENRQYTAQWANRPLSEFVEAHPNLFAVALATYVQTGVEFPMALGAGFVDILNLGKGAAEGGFGYVQDGLRFLSAVLPMIRGGQAGINQLLAMGREGNCAWIAAAKALMQTGTKSFASIGSLLKAGGAARGGVQSVSELIQPLKNLGANVRQLPQPKTIIDVVGATKAHGKGVVIFAFNWRHAAFVTKNNPTGAVGHAVAASWDAARGFLVADRSGKVVKTLSELETLYPGIGSAQMSGGMIFLENAIIPQAGLLKVAGGSSILDALAIEVKLVFSPTPEVAKAMQHTPTVRIGDPVIVRRTYTVQRGDWLSKITQRKYSDKRRPELLWPILHDANRAVIGPNPNVLKAGMKLTIPDISMYTEAQLENVRRRGRQWRQ